MKPSSDGGQFQVTLSGVTQSNTAGYTSQATIYTSGYHRFWAAKKVQFDGSEFQTSPAQISVDANNMTAGASTGFDGIPLLGSLGRHIARSEARKKRWQSEAITSDRIAQRVLPEMNREVDKNFAEANRRLQEHLNQRLEEAGIYPAATRVRSSESHLRLNAQVMGDHELAGGRPNSTLYSGSGLTIHLHESFLNNAVDRMKFAGRTMSDEEIRKEVERFLSMVTGKEVKLEEDDQKDAKDDKRSSLLVFAKTDPIRFRIDDGRVNLIIRAGFKQEGKEDIPTQVVTVPLTYSVEGNEIKIARGAVKVTPVDRPENRFKQTTRAGIMRNKIQSSIPDRTRESKFTIERKDKDDLDVNVTKIKALNGWVTIWAE